MRAARLPMLLALLATSLAPAAVGAQEPATATVVVRVTDRVTGKPVVNAALIVGARGVPAFTDSSGLATVTALPAGKAVLVASAPGYASDSVELVLGAAALTRTDVALAPGPVQLQPLHVAGRTQPRDPYLSRTGFYERQRLGGATFVTGEVLERIQRRSTHLVDAFRTISGFAIIPNRRGTGYALMSTRGSVSLRRQCYPQVYLDGIRIPYPSSALIDFDQVVPLSHVAAVEAFPGAALVPLEFGRHPCGTVLLWTRHGPAPAR